MKYLGIMACILGSVWLAGCQHSGATRNPAMGVHGTGVFSDALNSNSVMLGYFQLVKALSLDDTATADSSAHAMLDALNAWDQAASQSDSLKAIQGSLHGELLGFMGEPQLMGKRQELEMITALCQDMFRWVKPTREVIFKAYCPMYGAHGAYWFTDVDSIRNPYMGQAMPGCGEIQDTLTF